MIPTELHNVIMSNMSIAHVNEYPTMHHLGNPGHTQSKIAYDFD